MATLQVNGMAKQQKALAIGDRVAYSAMWLRSTGTFTGPLPRLRGSIVAFEPLGKGSPRIAVISWDSYKAPSQYHDDGLGRVLESNLTLVRRIAEDAA